jgi:hypothetical protein
VAPSWRIAAASRSTQEIGRRADRRRLGLSPGDRIGGRPAFAPGQHGSQVKGRVNAVDLGWVEGAQRDPCFRDAHPTAEQRPRVGGRGTILDAGDQFFFVRHGSLTQAGHWI